MVTYIIFQLLLILMLHTFILLNFRTVQNYVSPNCHIPPFAEPGYKKGTPFLNRGKGGQQLVHGHGLVNYLKHQILTLEMSGTVEVNFQIFGVPECTGQDAERALCNIIGESLENVAVHSRATRLTIILNYTAHHFECCIQDNGAGFIPGAAQYCGPGITRMKTIAAEIDAHLEITSIPFKGTLVRIHFTPLKP